MSKKYNASDIAKRVIMFSLFISQTILILLKVINLIDWDWWIVCIPNYLALSVFVDVWIMRKTKMLMRRYGKKKSN